MVTDVATESSNEFRTDNTARDTLGKFFFDLAKVTYTAMVVGGLMTVFTGLANIRYGIMIAFGFVMASTLAYLGYRIIKRKTT